MHIYYNCFRTSEVVLSDIFSYYKAYTNLLFHLSTLNGEIYFTSDETGFAETTFFSTYLYNISPCPL